MYQYMTFQLSDDIPTLICKDFKLETMKKLIDQSEPMWLLLTVTVTAISHLSNPTAQLEFFFKTLLPSSNGK